MEFKIKYFLKYDLQAISFYLKPKLPTGSKKVFEHVHISIPKSVN